MTQADAARPMTQSGHMRALLVLGLPIIGGHLGSVVIGMTDAIMVGWYGVTELAAIGIASSFLHLFGLVGSCFAWAAMPMVAEAAAKGDETQVRRATRMALWLSAAFGFCVLPALLSSQPIFRALGQDPEVAEAARAYLAIAAWSILPMLAINVIKAYLAGLEITRPVLWIILASALFNAGFNWVLIFGNLGAPELGLQGAAWATLLTQSLTLVAVALYAIWALPEHRIFRRFWRVDGQMLNQVFRLGWPIGLTTLAEAGLFHASAVMMGWLGKIPLAAHTIALQLASFTFVVHMGLSNAATVRVSNAMGRRDKEHLLAGANVAMVLSILFAALTVLAFVLIPRPLIWLFLDSADPAYGQVMTVGVSLLLAAALFQFVDGGQVVVLGLLRGLMDTRIPMIIAAMSYWGVGVPCSYLFGFVFGWEGFGIWMGLAVGLFLAAVFLYIRFRKLARELDFDPA